MADGGPLPAGRAQVPDWARAKHRDQTGQILQAVGTTVTGVKHGLNIAIWSRRIICLIHVNQALQCRVFISG